MRHAVRSTPQVILCFALCVVPCTWAQQTSNANNNRSNAATYGGGGVRGATADAPDGFLVSPEEMVIFNRDDAANNGTPKRSRSIEPALEILSPKPGQALVNPITVQVAMRSLTGVPLDLASVRVLYGASKVDITPRTQMFTQATADGFNLSGLRLPPGQHALFIEALDAKGQRVHTAVTLDVN